jgi:hypothetical protein
MCMASIDAESFDSLATGRAPVGDCGLWMGCRGDQIAPLGVMQRTIRTKVSYGFLILAFGLMLTDVCRLAWRPSGAAVSEANSTERPGKF